MQSLAGGHKDLTRMVSRLSYREDPRLRTLLSKNADAYAGAAERVAPDLRRLRAADPQAREYVDRWVTLAAQFHEVVHRSGTFNDVSMPALLDAVIDAEAKMTSYLIEHCDHVRWRVCVGRFERELGASMSKLLNENRVAVIPRSK